MINAKKTIPLLFLITLAACATVDPAHLSKEQEHQTIETARTKALPAVVASEEEKRIINQQRPKWGYYIISGVQAQYWFLWDLPDEVFMEVSGTGDIRTLEGANVVKRLKKYEIMRSQPTARPISANAPWSSLAPLY